MDIQSIEKTTNMQILEQQKASNFSAMERAIKERINQNAKFSIAVFTNKSGSVIENKYIVKIFFPKEEEVFTGTPKEIIDKINLLDGDSLPL